MNRRFSGQLKPLFGKIPISEINPRMAISAFQKLISQGKLQMLRGCVFDLNSVMNFAVNSGLIPSNPIIKIWSALPKPIANHMPTMRPEELPELMATLESSNCDIFTKLLIEWQLLTMVRPSEACGTRWSEIDIENALWRIPAKRMKCKREHIIPLSKQALRILESVGQFKRGDFVFYSSRKANSSVSHSALCAFMYRNENLKGRLVPHGLRALASTTLNELGFSPDVIEAALSHKSGDVMRDAYNRSNYFEQRKILMANWGDLVEKAKNGDAIIMDGNRGLRVIGL